MQNKSIAIIDIDGCLCDYPSILFFNFIKENYGIDILDIDILKKHVGINKYEEMKLAYRKSGIKRNIALKKGAKESIENIKSKKFKIWVVTSRPFIEPVYDDTKYWLEFSQIPYDELMFVDKKELFKVYLNRALIIDDTYNGLKNYLNNKNALKIMFSNKTEHDNINFVKTWAEVDLCFNDWILKNS